MVRAFLVVHHDEAAMALLTNATDEPRYLTANYSIGAASVECAAWAACAVLSCLA